MEKRKLSKCAKKRGNCGKLEFCQLLSIIYESSQNLEVQNFMFPLYTSSRVFILKTSALDIHLILKYGENKITEICLKSQNFWKITITSTLSIIYRSNQTVEALNFMFSLHTSSRVFILKTSAPDIHLILKYTQNKFTKMCLKSWNFWKIRILSTFEHNLWIKSKLRSTEIYVSII